MEENNKMNEEITIETKNLLVAVVEKEGYITGIYMLRSRREGNVAEYACLFSSLEAADRFRESCKLPNVKVVFALIPFLSIDHVEWVDLATNYPLAKFAIDPEFEEGGISYREPVDPSLHLSSIVNSLPPSCQGEIN